MNNGSSIYSILKKESDEEEWFNQMSALLSVLDYHKEEEDGFSPSKIISDSHLSPAFRSFKPFVKTISEYHTFPSLGNPASNNVRFNITPKGFHYMKDACIHIVIENIGAVETGDKVALFDFPGHKLIKSVTCRSKSTTYDTITTETYNNYYKWQVDESKRNSWKKCVGQEIPVEGYFVQNASDEYREIKQITYGHQTQKNTHDDLEMYIPLLFDFNTGGNPFEIDALTKTGEMLEFEVELEPIANLINCLDTDLSTTCTAKTAKITKIELTANCIYLQPEIMDMLRQESRLVLFRRHVDERIKAIGNKGTINLGRTTGMVEHMFINPRPDSNVGSKTWFRNDVLTLRSVLAATVAPGPVVGSNFVNYYETTANPIDKMNIKNNVGIEFFQMNNTSFYDAYIPMTKKHVKSPLIDKNSYLVPFNHNTLDFQPDGYFNRDWIANGTAADKLSIEYESSYITSSDTVTFNVSSTILDFIYYQDNAKPTVWFA